VQITGQHCAAGIGQRGTQVRAMRRAGRQAQVLVGHGEITSA
jgi:hypothetical protein